MLAHHRGLNITRRGTSPEPDDPAVVDWAHPRREAPMEIVTLRSRTVEQFGSTGVDILRLLPVHVTSGAASLHVARIAPGGTLGRHPTRQWQLFAVIEGSGWVAGPDDVGQPVEAGRAAVWKPGEEHSAGSDAGMLVVIAQSDLPPL
jgi:hypothetical protein